MNKMIKVRDCNDYPKVVVSLAGEIDVKIEPEKLAELFWTMDDNQQVEFINSLAKISGYKMAFQMQFITDNEKLSNDGRALMSMFGEYSSNDR